MQEGVVKSGLYLFEQTLLKIGRRTSKEYLKWINQVITVSLRSIELFEDLKEDLITKSIREMSSGLSQWMQKSQVFPFGASTVYGIWQGDFAASEIKVCNTIRVSI